MVTSGDYRYWKCIFEIKYEQLKTTIYVCVCVCVCVYVCVCRSLSRERLTTPEFCPGEFHEL